MAYAIKEAKELVLKAGLELCEAGLVARTWGNISARVSDTQYVITPSGRAYDTLTADDIVLVNIVDGSYEGDVKPSGEKGVHAAVYELCPKMNFVIHTHQNYASALSVLGREIAVGGAEESEPALLGNVLPCAEYGMYATDTLVNNIKAQIMAHPESKSVLMKYHGALCYGKDYGEAFAVAYELERVSEKIFDKLCGQKCKDYVNQKAMKHEVTIPERTFEISSELQQQLQSRDGITSILLAQTPYIVKMSNFGKTMYPYLDDVAQIAGVDVECVEGKASDGTQISDEAMEQLLLTSLTGRNAVLVKGIGALCTGFDESEAEAVAIVLEKACMAAYLAECVGNIAPLDEESAKKDREGYVNHYSKLK